MKQALKKIFYGYDIEQFLLPLGLWGLFLLIGILFFEGELAVDRSVAFLGYVMPLLSGVLAANALLNDTALELRFSTAQSAWRMLAERILLLFGFLALLAISFQVILAFAGVDYAKFGGMLQRQLVWAVPCLMMLTLGSLGSFLARNAIAGAGIVSGLWILQVVMRIWFAQEPVMQYIFLFQGMMRVHLPGSAGLIRNQISLTILSILFFIASGLLLMRQERYLK